MLNRFSNNNPVPRINKFMTHRQGLSVSSSKLTHLSFVEHNINRSTILKFAVCVTTLNNVIVLMQRQNDGPLACHVSHSNVKATARGKLVPACVRNTVYTR